MIKATNSITLLTTCIVMLFTACTVNKPPTCTEVSLLVDLTGSYNDASEIDNETIEDLFQLDHMNACGRFISSYIADVNYTQTKRASLAPVESIVDYNEFERDELCLLYTSPSPRDA